MKLNFTYDLSAHRILTEPEYRGALGRMKKSGVERIYLFGYFYGRFESDPEEISRAAKLLREDGFDVGAINLPCGHGGNALNPGDDTVDLTIGNGWSMRMDAAGRYLPTTTCIDGRMITDSREANETLKQTGITKLINDDDLRLGMYGPAVQGCFCPRCMAEFAEREGRTVLREEIVSGADPALTGRWMDFQCEKIPRFLKETTPEGMENGIMVMINGDRRHGIDLKKIREEIPTGLRYRVGEGHFSDRAFTSPQAEEQITRSVGNHLALIGNPDLCYSETTVFPANALSPENLVKKAELEIRTGLRNLYLMSGTWLLTEPYWDAFEKALPRLRALADETPCPIHSIKPYLY